MVELVSGGCLSSPLIDLSCLHVQISDLFVGLKQAIYRLRGE